MRLIETALYVRRCLRACGFADDVVRGAVATVTASDEMKSKIRREEALAAKASPQKGA